MRDLVYDDIVNNIKRLIEKSGIKQGIIAKRAYFSESEFSNMLNDRRKLIRAEHLPRIAKALDVEVSELFKVDV